MAATAIAPDPNAPRPLTMAQAQPPKLTLANGGLAGQPQAPLSANNGGAPPLTLAGAPQAPGQAGGTPPTPASTAIPSPTVAAPSAPVDRLSLAQSNFNNFATSTDPAYQQSLREATSQAAGAGQLGSGQLRTGIGDLALARSRDLDTQRQQLVNDATTGSIADASTAYQQQLAAAQQGLAGTVAGANISQGQQAQDTSRLGVTGGIAGQQAALQLAKGQAVGSVDGQQTQAAKDAAAQQAQAASALELAKGEATGSVGGQATLGAQQLALAKNTAQQQIDLATKSLAQSGLQFNASLAESTASRMQQGAQFDASQAQSAGQFQASLAQNATQFGLSQQQTTALAKLQNDTQNKSIDASTAQGQNQLLIQLAAIIGGPTGAVNPAAMAAIAQKFGVTLSKDAVNNPVVQTDPTKTGDTKDPLKVDATDPNNPLNTGQAQLKLAGGP
jgi:hypothetical protein